jgi:hypothetical protein
MRQFKVVRLFGREIRVEKWSLVSHEDLALDGSKAATINDWFPVLAVRSEESE